MKFIPRISSAVRKKARPQKWPTIVEPYCKTKEQYQTLLKKHIAGLSALQQLHYASNRYALLLIFQGMDSAARTAIRHVMSGVNPKAAMFSVSNNRAPRSWNMTSSGARHVGFLNADGSASSIVLLRRSADRSRASEILRNQRLPKSCATRKPSGRDGIARSLTLSAT